MRADEGSSAFSRSRALGGSPGAFGHRLDTEPDDDKTVVEPRRDDGCDDATRRRQE
jgi:hypothetical protein